MWYVIQVQGGQEEETERLIRKLVPSSVMKESFIPRKEKIRKFRGHWRQISEYLFPGYVFTETEKPEELFLELKRVTRLTKLLKDSESFFLPISEEEEKLLRSIGDKRHVTGISRLRIEEFGHSEISGERDSALEKKRKIVILSGPLMDHEGYIVGYNLHKREVTVRIPFMGQDTEIRMGIEIVGEKASDKESD